MKKNKVCSYYPIQFASTVAAKKIDSTKQKTYRHVKIVPKKSNSFIQLYYKQRAVSQNKTHHNFKLLKPMQYCSHISRWQAKSS